MRTPSTSISEALFGAYRERVLALLLSHPDESFHVREIARRTGVPAGSLHRELKLLSHIELVGREPFGNQIRYRANTASPVFAELSALLAKTVGVAEVLRKALASLGGRVQLAFIFGSVARRQERARSDVDLFVIGAASFVDVVKALSRTSMDLGREINPVVMTPETFREKITAGDSFLSRLLPERKVFVKGTDDELAKLAENPPAHRTHAQRRRNTASPQSRSAQSRRRGRHQYQP